MEEDEIEDLTIETVEIAGDIVDEPILSKSIRELKLGSKEHRKIQVGPFFCECGKAITKENATRCSHCTRLICKDCGILYLNEIHCTNCLKEDHQIFLTKTDYMILLCVSNGIADVNTTFRLTGIKPNIVKDRIAELLEKYVTREPSSLLEKLFPQLRLTALGQDALGVFEAIYSKDADCASMKQKLQEFLAERTRSSYSLRVEEADTICSSQES